MSQVKVQTTYFRDCYNGTSEEVKLYCWHYPSADTVSFFNETGEILYAEFHESGEPGKRSLFEAMQLLYEPFRSHQNGLPELREGVKYFNRVDWGFYGKVTDLKMKEALEEIIDCQFKKGKTLANLNGAISKARELLRGEETRGV
jgi:hypothetical protein